MQKGKSKTKEQNLMRERDSNILVCVYLINEQRIHSYRQQSVYGRTRKRINLQYFEKNEFETYGVSR